MNKNKRNGQSKKYLLSGKDNIEGLFYFAKVLPALTKPLTTAFFLHYIYN